jgi:hypothetical protein
MVRTVTPPHCSKLSTCKYPIQHTLPSYAQGQRLSPAVEKGQASSDGDGRVLPRTIDCIHLFVEVHLQPLKSAKCDDAGQACRCWLHAEEPSAAAVGPLPDCPWSDLHLLNLGVSFVQSMIRSQK